MLLDDKLLSESRDRLLETAVRYFSRDPVVIGIFVAGSVAAGSADAYSDIDLRIVVESSHYRRILDRCRDFPKLWPDFMFNECLPNTDHCVSHFRPLTKIDIFYYSKSDFYPSPWYGLPTKIFHDPEVIVYNLTERSRNLHFVLSTDELDCSLSKGLSNVHEAFRRAKRGELIYAMSLLDAVRRHVMQADDWLHDRMPMSAVMAKFDMRGSGSVLASLKATYCSCEANAILSALRLLAVTYRAQLSALHGKFRMSRSLHSDLEAIDVVLAQLE